MPRPALEVADIFRDHGPAWRHANRGHISLDQLKVMSAIEQLGLDVEIRDITTNRDDLECVFSFLHVKFSFLLC